MIKTRTPQDFHQVRMALQEGKRIPPFRGAVTIFWGLIVAKCFLLEWAVRAYDIPINSALYIWFPTLLFAVACTWAYSGSAMKNLLRRPLLGRYVAAIWSGAAISAFILCVVTATLETISFYILPALLSLVLGSAYFVHSIIDSRIPFKIAAYCWWTASLFLFYKHDLSSLYLFSLFIVLFQVLPTTYLYLKENLPTKPPKAN